MTAKASYYSNKRNTLVTHRDVFFFILYIHILFLSYFCMVHITFKRVSVSLWQTRISMSHFDVHLKTDKARENRNMQAMCNFSIFGAFLVKSITVFKLWGESCSLLLWHSTLWSGASCLFQMKSYIISI